MVSKELLQADVGKWVLEEAFEGAKTARYDVSTGAGSIDDVLTVADGSGEDFRVVILDFVDLGDFLDQLHSVPSDIVDAAYEWTYVGCACFGGEDSLASTEYQRTVGTDALGGTPRKGFYAFADHGNLNYDVIGDFYEFAGFFLHAFEVGTDHFSAYVAAGDGTDLLIVGHYGLGTTNFLFGHQAGVGGHSIKDAEGFGFGNVVEVGSIDEELHVGLLLILG
ncbi:MAG: hypothetical protein ACI819_002355 [Neolewinella sp.]|jgi:hypothetical protein